MDIAFDTTWCPVCSRQILPKRYYVPINPQPPQAPVVPPSSPTSDSKPQQDASAPRLPRNKTGTIRARGGGLVHGTGRVKPNGALKRNETVKKVSPVAPLVDAEPTLVRPSGPVRHRTVIDQSPVPLYCSDECRLADLQSTHSAIGIDYHPDRCTSPTLPPVPHNSFSDFSSQDESDAGSGASYESRSSLASSPPSNASTGSRIPKGYAALQYLYGDLPELPPAPPLKRRDTNESEASSLEDYCSGVIMAARRINSALSQEPPKKNQYGYTETKERKPIPGWTDGTHAWRASVYNLTAPSKTGKPDAEKVRNAYKGFVASSHRSGGVYSTLSDTAPTAPVFSSSSSVASLPMERSSSGIGPSSRSRSAAEELYSKYPLFARRIDSRSSLAPQSVAELSTSPIGSTRSLPVSTSGRRKEFSLVKPGAEGRLLVPDVKMTRASSTLSIASEASSSWSSSRGYYGAPDRKRSPLSRQNSDTSMETADTRDTEDSVYPLPSSLPITEKTKPTMRAWSYSDDVMTYPILQIPKKVKRIERRVVNGREEDVEVEVEVVQPLKRLFNFPPKEVR